MMANCSKIILLYDKAYWKENNFSGESLSDGLEAPIAMSFDDSRTKENGEVQPALVVFVVGAMDREWTKDK